jgi:FRG domain
MTEKPQKERPHNTTSIIRKKAESLSEYIAIIEAVSAAATKVLWFRGQSSASHRLSPSVLRETKRHTDIFGRLITPGQIVTASGGQVTGMNPERMLDNFKRRSRPFIDQTPENDFEWMFIAQHHGLPTRLLDWSTNALAAFFFAVSGAKSIEGDGATACSAYVDDGDEFRDDGSAVFVMDPGEYNEKAYGLSDPVDVAAHAEQWGMYLDPMAAKLPASKYSNFAPLCVYAPHMSTRIRAQSGVFTLHGRNIWPIDYYDDFRPLITKIFVPYTATLNVTRSLSSVGVNASFIYPGLDTIALDVAAEERDRGDETGLRIKSKQSKGAK